MPRSGVRHVGCAGCLLLRRPMQGNSALVRQPCPAPLCGKRILGRGAALSRRKGERRAQRQRRAWARGWSLRGNCAPILAQVDGRPGRAALVLAAMRLRATDVRVLDRESAPALAQVDGRPGRAALVLAARRLRAVEAQARLRAGVEREQAEITAMNERAYRKFARQCMRQRSETAKAVRGPGLPPLYSHKGRYFCASCGERRAPARLRRLINNVNNWLLLACASVWPWAESGRPQVDMQGRCMCTTSQANSCEVGIARLDVGNGC